MVMKSSVKRTGLFILLLCLLAFVTGCSNQKSDVTTKYILSIARIGEGEVEPEEGTHKYEEGTVVSLSAVPDTANGWFFSKWGGPDGGIVNEENKVLIDGDKSIYAVFNRADYNLDITINPENSGQVYRELLSTIQSIGHGETIRLTAVSNTGYAFDHWEGALDVSDNPATLEMDRDKEVTAVFNKLDYNR